MQKNTEAVEIAVQSAVAISVNKKRYLVSFPVFAVAILEKQLKRSMKSPIDWMRLATSELEATLRAGLLQHHPQEAKALAKEICDGLDPESIEKVLDTLCVAACPRAMERIRAELEKVKDRAKQGLSPKAQSEAAH